MKTFNKYDLQKFVEVNIKMDSKELADKIRVEVERVFCISLAGCADTNTIAAVLKIYHEMINSKQSTIY